MNFEEFKNINFAGDTDAAIECLAKEVRELEFAVTKSGAEWRMIIESMDEDVKEKFKKFQRTLKSKLTAKSVLSSMNEYKIQRLVFSVFVGIGVFAWLGLTIISGMFNIIFYLLTTLFGVGAFLMWVFKKNKVLTALKKGDYFIDKAPCSYKNVKTESVDWSDVDSFTIFFAGYEGYKTRKSTYENTDYGEEYFLVVLNGSRKILNIYSTKAFELSDEFYENNGKYYLKK